jgi:hypothetical protein
LVDVMVTYGGKPVLFVDIEASAQEQGSYPIEVGWAPAGLEDGDGCHASWLPGLQKESIGGSSTPPRMHFSP